MFVKIVNGSVYSYSGGKYSFEIDAASGRRYVFNTNYSPEWDNTCQAWIRCKVISEMGAITEIEIQKDDESSVRLIVLRKSVSVFIVSPDNPRTLQANR